MEEDQNKNRHKKPSYRDPNKIMEKISRQMKYAFAKVNMLCAKYYLAVGKFDRDDHKSEHRSHRHHHKERSKNGVSPSNHVVQANENGEVQQKDQKSITQKSSIKPQNRQNNDQGIVIKKTIHPRKYVSNDRPPVGQMGAMKRKVAEQKRNQKETDKKKRDREKQKEKLLSQQGLFDFERDEDTKGDKSGYMQKSQFEKSGKQVEQQEAALLASLTGGKKLLEKPKAPITPYFLFLAKNNNKITLQYPDLKPNEINDMMGKIWQQITEAEKLPYTQQYQKNKRQYDILMKEYNRQNPDNISKMSQFLEKSEKQSKAKVKSEKLEAQKSEKSQKDNESLKRFQETKKQAKTITLNAPQPGKVELDVSNNRKTVSESIITALPWKPKANIEVIQSDDQSKSKKRRKHKVQHKDGREQIVIDQDSQMKDIQKQNKQKDVMIQSLDRQENIFDLSQKKSSKDYAFTQQSKYIYDNGDVDRDPSFEQTPMDKGQQWLDDYRKKLIEQQIDGLI